MKQVMYFALLLMIMLTACEKSPVTSDCELGRNDSNYDTYLKDAEQLVLRRILEEQLPEKDDILLPQADIDRILEALAAVYNAADNLNPADKVVNDHQIHTLQRRSLNTLILYVDSSYEWTQEWMSGNLLSGNTAIDDLMNTHNLSIKDILPGISAVVLESANTLNTKALANAFSPIEGITLVAPSGLVGDGNDIEMLEYGTEIVLQYSTGEGDCPSGCTSHDYWNFRVNEDCEVEFLGCSEDPL